MRLYITTPDKEIASNANVLRVIDDGKGWAFYVLNKESITKRLRANLTSTILIPTLIVPYVPATRQLVPVPWLSVAEPQETRTSDRNNTNFFPVYSLLLGEKAVREGMNKDKNTLDDV